jgi:hypothetical protein
MENLKNGRNREKIKLKSKRKANRRLMFTDKKYPIKQKKITFTLKYKNDEKLEKTSFQSSSFTL